MRKTLWEVWYLNRDNDERVIYILATSPKGARLEARAHIAERCRILSCKRR